MKKILILFLSTILLYSCSKDTSSTNLILNPPPPPPSTYHVGDIGPASGRIVHIPDTQIPFYIESAPNILPRAPWGCKGTLITYTYPQNYSNGQSSIHGFDNTIDITNQCSEINGAAKICGDLVINGFDDWYLPSMSELNMAYQGYSEAVLNSPANGVSGPSGFWWSSNQYNSNTAWVDKRTGDVTQRYTTQDKSDSVWCRIIAVRKFQ